MEEDSRPKSTNNDIKYGLKTVQDWLQQRAVSDLQTVMTVYDEDLNLILRKLYKLYVFLCICNDNSNNMISSGGHAVLAALQQWLSALPTHCQPSLRSG